MGVARPLLHRPLWRSFAALCPGAGVICTIRWPLLQLHWSVFPAFAFQLPSESFCRYNKTIPGIPLLTILPSGDGDLLNVMYESRFMCWNVAR